MFRRSPLRPLLRWISLLACATLLGVLGASNMHQRNFTGFLVSVLGLAVLTVVVFVATASRGELDQE